MSGGGGGELRLASTVGSGLVAIRRLDGPHIPVTV